jgi:hypothetical protein
MSSKRWRLMAPWGIHGYLCVYDGIWGRLFRSSVPETPTYMVVANGFTPSAQRGLADRANVVFVPSFVKMETAGELTVCGDVEVEVSIDQWMVRSAY